MMAKGKKPTQEKDPRKVAAGKMGGLAKAIDQRKGSGASERSAKRKNATPLNYSSDLRDELADNKCTNDTQPTTHRFHAFTLIYYSTTTSARTESK